MATWPRTRDGVAWGTALAICFVVVDSLLVIGTGQTRPDSVLSSSLGQAFIASQYALVAIWFAMSRAPFLGRVACLAILAQAWLNVTSPNDYAFGYHDHVEQLIGLGQLILIVPLPLLLMRLAGWEIGTAAQIAASRRTARLLWLGPLARRRGDRLGRSDRGVGNRGSPRNSRGSSCEPSDRRRVAGPLHSSCWIRVLRGRGRVLAK